MAEAVNGLTDFLEVERKRRPDHVLRDAERLECLLFSGYDPYFEGDEPPDCKCGPTTQRPYYLGGSDDPFTEVVRASDSGQEQPWYPIN